MTGRHSPRSYIAKAESALSEARILIQASTVNGPCNRAYFAMLYEVIVPSHLPRALGNDLGKVGELRLLADYSDDTVKMERAVWAVERAEAFVSAVRKKFGL